MTMSGLLPAFTAPLRTRDSTTINREEMVQSRKYTLAFTRATRMTSSARSRSLSPSPKARMCYPPSYGPGDRPQRLVDHATHGKDTAIGVVGAGEAGGEERLVSYAVGLGTEVKPEVTADGGRLTHVKAVKGALHTTTKVRETKTYTVKNRNPQDRTVLIEHPARPDFKNRAAT